MDSFSGIIHRYIEATTAQELTQVKKETVERWLQELRFWSRGVLDEFIPHFGERFKNARTDSAQWTLDIDKWNWMGFILAQLQAYKWAIAIYRALYGLLCDLQTTRGERVHKGTPLHQIGWVNLLQGTPESIRASQCYMKLAMIEDRINCGDDSFKTQPAFTVLKAEHRLPEPYLDRIAAAVISYRQKYRADPCLRPELIYLDFVIDRQNQERSSLYDFDSNLGTELLNKVKQAESTDEKGKSLEMLLAYLFLTCPGFEVIRNLIGFDCQIDLLVRNLHTADPIFEELGRYILVECRNIIEKVDAKAVRDFSTKVIQANCNSGILVAKTGYTGDREKDAARDARLAILKALQRHRIVIVPITLEQLEPIVRNETSLLAILVSEYEKIRFDLA